MAYRYSGSTEPTRNLTRTTYVSCIREKGGPIVFRIQEGEDKPADYFLKEDTLRIRRVGRTLADVITRHPLYANYSLNSAECLMALEALQRSQGVDWNLGFEDGDLIEQFLKLSLERQDS